MHSGCITAHDHITPKWSILSKPEGNISSKKMNVNIKDICVPLENKNQQVKKNLEKTTKLRQFVTFIYIIFTN